MRLGIRGCSDGVILDCVANFDPATSTHDVGFFCVADPIILWRDDVYRLLYFGNNFARHPYEGLRVLALSDGLFIFDIQ